MDKDLNVLKRIIEYCDRIENTMSRFGKDFTVFVNDWDYRSSIAFNIQQIGELAKKLSKEFVDNTNDSIPWHDISGMRDLFAHQYDYMDLDEIWHTANQDIPELKEFCENIVSNNS